MSMEHLIDLLYDHAARYPKMEPTDAVKLLYQNEFGGGHLIRDPETFLQYLRQEYESIPKDAQMTKCEDIGNGRMRVYLAPLSNAELEQLGQDFLRDAQTRQGSLDIFLQKLALLRQVTTDGVFAFGLEALDDYLSAYAAAGYPMVSHSEAYRNAYRPAYRVIHNR